MLNNIKSDDESDKNSMTKEKKESPNMQQPPSLFSRLIDGIKNTFAPPLPRTTPLPLQGRINESPSKQANKILDHFLDVAQKFEKHLDDELVIHVQTAMESIKRDFHRIQKKASQSTNNQNEVVLHNWMKKAKGWIELDAKLHDRAAIINAVIKQQFSALDELIDQDLQLIFDYETHILSDLPIEANEKSKIEQMILTSLTPHTQALIKLKAQPPTLELHKFAQWKETIDRTRGHHFEKALHAIDAIVDKISPASSLPVEPNQKLDAITSEIDLLQKKSTMTLQEAFELVAHNDEIKKKLESSLLALQQQSHRLSGDLNLTQDHFEQLQAIQSDLEQIEGMLHQN
ncbi:MAG: hypothetical protein H0W50_03325 [Parachlamydiaceae bacterium]|nr:hypothetical protein [Parachlamydiaceae bacterium]